MSDKWDKLQLAIDNQDCVTCGAKAELAQHFADQKRCGADRARYLFNLCDACHEMHHKDSSDVDNTDNFGEVTEEIHKDLLEVIASVINAVKGGTKVQRQTAEVYVDALCKIDKLEKKMRHE